MTGVLSGIRVLEVAQSLAGPWCGRILAGLGATVTKVEPPSGDAARHWGPPFDHGDGTLFSLANVDKRSVTLDLSTPRGIELLRRLIADTDVVVESLRPGALRALGVDAAGVCREHPRLVWVSVTAYGETGPLAGLPGYEPLMQAHAGIMASTGEADGPPVRVGTSVVDLGTGNWAALAVLAALRERERTGRGARLGTALFDTALALSGYHLLGTLADGTVAGRHGTALPMICPYGVFPAADEGVMVAVGTDALFRRFARALERPEWLDDPRFTTNPERVEHRLELDGLVAERTRRWSATELIERLRAAGVPCAPILDSARVLEDPQTEASEMIAHVPDGEGGTRPAIPLPIRWDGARPAPAAPPPRAGSDTDRVLAELGLGAREIEDLRRDGVV